MSAAALVPAPPPALPVLVAVCIGLPLIAAWELPAAVAALRVWRRGSADAGLEPMDGTSLWELRRRLQELPETEHPLGY